MNLIQYGGMDVHNDSSAISLGVDRAVEQAAMRDVGWSEWSGHILRPRRFASTYPGMMSKSQNTMRRTQAH